MEFIYSKDIFYI